MINKIEKEVSKDIVKSIKNIILKAKGEMKKELIGKKVKVKNNEDMYGFHAGAIGTIKRVVFEINILHEAEPYDIFLGLSNCEITFDVEIIDDKGIKFFANCKHIRFLKDK